MEYLVHLIKTKATGSPRELARKLEVSERTVYGLLSMLKELEGPVCYDSLRKTYYFKNEGDFYFRFKRKA
jgi:DNA-binding IclR family transcriptional regulator